MVPHNYTLPEIKRGDTYPNRDIAEITAQTTGDPVNVASARMQIRNADDDSDVLFEWTTTNNSITISGAGNNILNLRALTNTETSAFPPAPNHKYDLEITRADGRVNTILRGNVCVSADITRTL